MVGRGRGSTKSQNRWGQRPRPGSHSKSDHSIFYKNSSSGIILLVVYVDDIVIIESDSKGILSLKSFLHSQFHTKDLGILKYFLGVEVMRNK